MGFSRRHAERADIPVHQHASGAGGDLKAIQVAQGDELLSGPANTSLPVILVGDFNSRVDGTGTETYGNLIEAGFEDAWSATHPGELGNTWGHRADLLNTTVNLTQRLDLVLFRNNLCALDAEVVGDELADRTPSGLWPSDHAGVVASLGLHIRPRASVGLSAAPVPAGGITHLPGAAVPTAGSKGSSPSGHGIRLSTSGWGVRSLLDES